MKGFNKNQRVEKGQTLLEILLAFSVSIAVLSAVILGVITSLSNTQYTKNQGLANSYAQEGMAVIRKIRDSSWADFSTKLSDFSTNTKYCIDKNLVLQQIPLSANCVGNNLAVGAGEIFSREVTFEHSSDSCATNCPGPACLKGSKATVKVLWSDNKCPIGTSYCHKVELITCFSNIDQKLNP